ncbi:MAG: hypothetical protein AAGH70_00965 [Pseudomonadota bacterium]
MLESLSRDLLAALPRYGSNLWGALRDPVGFVTPRAAQGDMAWEALAFWAMSYALSLLVSYFMLGNGGPPAVFFITSFMTNGLHLLLTVLGFILVWRLARYRAGPAELLTAGAFCWGAVLPITAFLHVLLLGILRVVSEEGFVIGANLLNGCADVVAAANLNTVLESATVNMGLYGLLAALLFIALFAVSFGFSAYFYIAFLRIIRRLYPVRLFPFLLLAALGTAGWFLAGSASAGFALMVHNDPARCIAPRA